MTTTVLILPGLYNSGEYHWQSHWLRQYPTFRKVEQLDWKTPAASDWVAQLNREIEAAAGEVVLVAHSLACTLVCRWAEQHPDNRKVRAALLVALSDTEAPSYPAGTTGFTPMSMRRLPFPTIAVASTNDEYVSVPRAQAFSDAWGSELIWLENAGHINGPSGYGPWPQGLALLARLLGDEAGPLGVGA